MGKPRTSISITTRLSTWASSFSPAAFLAAAFKPFLLSSFSFLALTRCASARRAILLVVLAYGFSFNIVFKNPQFKYQTSNPIQKKKQLFIERDSGYQEETNKKKKRKKKQSISCKVIMRGPVTLDTHNKQ
ncbi:unnamed protein product, partial [Vitis vinifera]